MFPRLFRPGLPATAELGITSERRLWNDTTSIVLLMVPVRLFAMGLLASCRHSPSTLSDMNLGSAAAAAVPSGFSGHQRETPPKMFHITVIGLQNTSAQYLRLGFAWTFKGATAACRILQGSGAV